MLTQQGIRHVSKTEFGFYFKQIQVYINEYINIKNKRITERKRRRVIINSNKQNKQRGGEQNGMI